MGTMLNNYDVESAKSDGNLCIISDTKRCDSSEDLSMKKGPGGPSTIYARQWCQVGAPSYHYQGAPKPSTSLGRARESQCGFSSLLSW